MDIELFPFSPTSLFFCVPEFTSHFRKFYANRVFKEVKRGIYKYQSFY